MFKVLAGANLLALVLCQGCSGPAVRAPARSAAAEAPAAKAPRPGPKSRPVARPALRLVRGQGSPLLLGTTRLRHEAGVRALALSGDGRRLATIDDRGTLRLWDAGSGTPLGRPRGQRAGAVALDADGGRVAGVHALPGRPRGPLQLEVREVDSDRLVHREALPHDRVDAVAFSPSGHRLALSVFRGPLLFWDTRTWRRSTLPGSAEQEHGSVSLVFAPRGDVVASGRRGRVELWDLARRKLLRELRGGPGAQFLAGGRLLALQTPRSDEQTGQTWLGLTVWDWRRGRAVRRALAESWDHSAFAFGPGGRWVVLAHEDGANYSAAADVRIVKWPSGRPLSVLAGSRAEKIALARGGGVLATTAGTHRVQLWRPPSGEALGADDQHQAAVRAALLLAGGRRVTSSAGQLHHWDSRTGARLGHTTGFGVAHRSREGDLLAYCRRRATRRAPALMELYEASAAGEGPLWSAPRRCTRWAVADRFTSAYTPACRVYHLDLRASREPRQLFDDNCSSRVDALWISADGRRVAALLRNAPVVGKAPWGPKKWHARGRFRLMLRRLDQDKNSLLELPDNDPTTSRIAAFSSDGELLALGGLKGTVYLHSAATGLLLRRLPGHDQPVTALAFSRDGSTLISAAEDSTLRLWPLQQGDPQAQRVTLPSVATALDMSGDGALLVTGHRDTALRLWRLARKQ